MSPFLWDELEPGEQVAEIITVQGPVVVRRKREGIQLCKVYDPKKPPKFREVYLEPKLDGIRGIVVVKDGKAIAYSSTGLLHYNVGHILKIFEESAVLYPALVDNRTFDGEFLIHGIDQPEAFDVTSGLLRRHDFDERSLAIDFHVWDTILTSEFESKTCTRTQESRKISLDCATDAINHLQIIKVVAYRAPNNPEAIKHWTDLYLEHGYEGIVLKDVDGIYQFRKSGVWLKWKPFIDGDMEIIGAMEGRGKHAGILGNLMVRGYLCDDGNISPDRDSDSVPGGQMIECEVGMGKKVSDLDRDRLWKQHLRGELVGLVAEIYYQNLTKDGAALRMGKFRRLREDKS
jgi:ATP-dependent DNA ligase